MRYKLRWPKERKVLFIIPSLNNNYPNSAHDAVDTDVVHPSLGVLYISSYIKQNGFNTFIIDDLVNTEPSEYRMKKIISEENVCIVFITCMSANFDVAVQYAQAAKQEGCFVAIGGPHASCNYFEIVTLPYFDVAIIGEGEKTSLELLEALYNQADFANIKGIAYEENGQVIYTGKRSRIQQLDQLPLPDYDSIDMSLYLQTQSLGLITSRGCPNSCLFCSSRNIWGREVYFRSVENIIHEMDYICDQFDYKGKNLVFFDDVFSLNRDRLITLCRIMKTKCYSFNWKCMCRIDQIDLEMLTNMKTAGCNSISFGVESASDKTLSLINKNITLEKVDRVIEMCQSVGIKFHGYFMIGFPWETKEDFSETLNYIVSHPTIESSLSILTPYPGTSFYDNQAQWNISVEKSWDKFNHISAVIRSAKHTKADLYEAYSKYILHEERRKNNEDK